ncbi:MAG: hypothetical protein IID39_07255 [Planctomycetes bacterium]|nr:hypothetical protein [Planctomycetota bacterium]
MKEEREARELYGSDELDDDTGSPPDADSEPESHPSGLITAAEARESAATWAALRKSQSIYCYASRNQKDTGRDCFSEKTFAPKFPAKPADMWDAQVSLWIQEDVVESLARLNDETAEALRAAGKRPWVGNLPVKEVIEVSVSKYVLSHLDQADVSLTGKDGVFTKNESNELYEVVHFTVILVVDARDIPAVIEAISKDKFHTLLNLRWEYNPSSLVSLRMDGKIYGPEPVVRLVMDFETVFFGDIYRRIMPGINLGEIGRSRPKDEKEES